MENNDFVKELGYLGFTMRLKRITDAMMQEGRKLYDHLNLDIEPNWYVIFLLLDKQGPKTIMEISSDIRMAHPSVIAIINKMNRAGYIVSEKDESDSRKRVLNLTEKARQHLPKYEKIWQAGEMGMEKALEELDALVLLEKLEERFFSKGFCERTLEIMNNGQ